LNNPLKYIDPSGHWGWLLGLATVSAWIPVVGEIVCGVILVVYVAALVVDIVYERAYDNESNSIEVDAPRFGPYK
jgi:hypothetical protein